MPKLIIQVDNDFEVLLYDVDRQDAAEKWAKRKIELALKRGATVTFEGVTLWHDFQAHVDLDETGSDQYTWDLSGERVKGDLVEFSRIKGKLSHCVVKTTWRKFL